MNTNGSAMSGGGSGAKTFQNTINIGSFINEINSHNKDGQMANVKTFSNTIDNTDESMEETKNNDQPQTGDPSERVILDSVGVETNNEEAKTA